MTTFTTEQISTLKRNLDETSYHEGSEALACRLSDCKTYIEQLEYEKCESSLKLAYQALALDMRDGKSDEDRKSTYEKWWSNYKKSALYFNQSEDDCRSAFEAGRRHQETLAEKPVAEVQNKSRWGKIDMHAPLDAVRRKRPLDFVSVPPETLDKIAEAYSEHLKNSQTPSPIAEQASQGDERAEFEKWWDKYSEHSETVLPRIITWHAWQARASIARGKS